MPIDYSKLKGKIVEILGSQRAFAKVMGMSERSCSLKITGQRAFTQTEIVKAIQVLGLKEEEIANYFFKEKV